MAETFGEFDQPSPMPLTYCQRISKKKFEQQTISTTEKALNDLLNYLEYNPTPYYEILRKRKLEEEEEKGWLSFVKVKLFNTVYGDDWEVVDAKERTQSINEVKDQMVQAFNYSLDAKGSQKRFSRRLAAKRNLNRKRSTCTIKEETLNEPCLAKMNYENPAKSSRLGASPIFQKQSNAHSSTCVIPCPPVAPPLPPDMTTRIHAGIVADHQKPENLVEQIRLNQHQLKENPRPTMDCGNKSKYAKTTDNFLGDKTNPNIKKRLRSVPQSAAKTTDNFLGDITNPDIKKRLRPIPQRRRSREGRSTGKTVIKYGQLHFNHKLLDKFRNARSPIETSPSIGSPLSPGSNFTP